MTGVLYGIARFCVRRKFIVLAVWLVVAVALVAISKQMGDNTNDNLSLPGTNSQHATDILKASFPIQANGTSPIVLHASNGKLTDSKYSSAVNEAATDLAKQPERRLGRQSAHARGRLGAQQGPGDRIPDRRSQGQSRLAVGGAGAGHHRRGRQTGGGRRAGGPDRRAARPEGLQDRHRVQRADRDHRRGDHPDVHVRDGRRDARPDHHRDLRAAVDARDHPHARSRRDGADGRADARDDDRPRRRDRLRAVHRHPAPARVKRRLRHGRVDRPRGGDLRRRGVLRRVHGHDRARVAGGGGDPAGHDDGPDGRDRGGRRGARRVDAAPRRARDPRSAAQLAARAPPADRRGRASRHVGDLGERHRQAARDRWARGARDPDPADDPAAVAHASGSRTRRRCRSRPPPARPTT